jgi:hypothetical protein
MSPGNSGGRRSPASCCGRDEVPWGIRTPEATLIVGVEPILLVTSITSDAAYATGQVIGYVGGSRAIAFVLIRRHRR